MEDDEETNFDEKTIKKRKNVKPKVTKKRLQEQIEKLGI